MTDPALIEVAVQALQQGEISASDEELLALVIAAVTPLIEAAVLERAAQFVENDYYRTEGMAGACDHIAAAIRALNKPMEKT